MKVGISVIIPVFNRSAFLRESLISALEEISKEDEIIVIDDGSTEDITQDIADLLPKIRLFRKKNGGVASARNYGIQKSKNDWLAFLDSDDIWLPGRFRSFRSDSSTNLPYTVHISNVRYTGEGYSRDLFSLKPVTCNMVAPEVIDTPLAHVISGMTLQGAVISKSIWSKYGGFNENMKNYSDTDFFARASLCEKFKFDPTIVSNIRRLDGDDTSLTSLESKNRRKSLETWVSYLERLSLNNVSQHQKSIINERLSGTYFLLALTHEEFSERLNISLQSIKYSRNKVKSTLKFVLAICCRSFSSKRFLNSREFIRK